MKKVTFSATFSAIVIFLLVMLISFAIGCNDEPPKGTAQGSGGIQGEETSSTNQITISDVTILQRGENQSTSVVYKVNNPNLDYGLSRVALTVTLKDAQGKVITTNSNAIPGSVYGTQFLVAPGETHEFVYDVMGSAKGAASADIQIDQKWQKFSSEDVPKVKVISINAIPQGSGYVSLPDKLTGEVANESDVKLNILVHIVARENGKIVGASEIMVDDVEPGKTKAFEDSSATGIFSGKQITTYAHATHIPKLNNAPPDLRN